MQGRSLKELLEDPTLPWREEIFLENLYTGRSNPFIEAVRTRDWKYVRYFARPGDTYEEGDVDFRRQQPVLEQLFDLKKDPGELRNEAGNPAHSAVLERLRTRCASYSAGLLKQRDG
jgi:hypothetical protein